MVSSISNNSIQSFSALNAFRNANKALEKTPFELESSSGLNVNDKKDMLKDVDVVDIKNYATQMGEGNLTDDDIRYGITYGRSVIADYIA